MQYQNFELVIQRRDRATRSYSVFVQGADGASHQGGFSLQTQWDRIETLTASIASRAAAIQRSAIPRIEHAADDESMPRELGQLLFQAVFGGKVGVLMHASELHVKDQDAGHRIRLRMDGAPELLRLPWEYLHDGREFIATNVHAPIVRYAEQDDPPETLTVRGALRMLVVISSPADAHPLDVGTERAQLERSMAELVASGRIEIDYVDSGRWRDVVEALSPGKDGKSYHVFHFIGHGGVSASGEGYLLFTDAEGRGVPQDADGIATLLRNHRPLRLGVLNACKGAASSADDSLSSVAAALIGRAVPAVVAMQFAITDRAALDFARNFYGLLADGNPVDAAVALTRMREYTRLQKTRSLEWATPVLYLQSPDGVLFDLPSAKPVKRFDSPARQVSSPTGNAGAASGASNPPDEPASGPRTGWFRRSGRALWRMLGRPGTSEPQPGITGPSAPLAARDALRYGCRPGSERSTCDTKTSSWSSSAVIRRRAATRSSFRARTAPRIWAASTCSRSGIESRR